MENNQSIGLIKRAVLMWAISFSQVNGTGFTGRKVLTLPIGKTNCRLAKMLIPRSGKIVLYQDRTATPRLKTMPKPGS
jgi:predicted membrane protein